MAASIQIRSSSPEILPVLAEMLQGGIYFNKTQGFCFLCNTALTSLSMKTDHEKGRAHEKALLNNTSVFNNATKLESARITWQPRMKQGVCHLCNDFQFYSRQELIQHLHDGAHIAHEENIVADDPSAPVDTNSSYIEARALDARDEQMSSNLFSASASKDLDKSFSIVSYENTSVVDMETNEQRQVSVQSLFSDTTNRKIINTSQNNETILKQRAICAQTSVDGGGNNEDGDDGRRVKEEDETVLKKRAICAQPAVDGAGNQNEDYDHLAISSLPPVSPVNARSKSHGHCGSRAVAEVIRRDGNYEFDDHVMILPTLAPTEHSNEENTTRRIGNAISSSGSQGVFDENISETETTSENETDPLTDINSSTNVQVESKSETFQQMSVTTSKQTANFRFTCKLCNQSMNTEKDYEIHKRSFKHQTKEAMAPAPDNSCEKLVRLKQDKRKLVEAAYNSCNGIPRHYQVKLLRKVMHSNSTVVFLPTGSGKTFVALMTMSYMLTLNPTRPVLFLVDKVLLVLQQAKYIIAELGLPHTFIRSDPEIGSLMRRELKVAMLCGGMFVRDATPLWQYDVIVTTAAYCQNLLEKKALQWCNFSLVVFDEAHHCTKKHPYNQLLKAYHHQLDPSKKPKILGLTASPAGKSTETETLSMLRELLENLDKATMVTVVENNDAIDDKIAWDELQQYSSNAKMVILYIPMAEMEQEFRDKLYSYFDQVFKKLVNFSSLPKACSQNDNEGIFQEELGKRIQLAQTEGIRAQTKDLEENFNTIQTHVKNLGRALLSIEDGIDFVLEDFEHLLNPDQNPDFHKLVAMDLPCQDMAKYVYNLRDSFKFQASEEEERPQESKCHMSIFNMLLEILNNSEYIDWDSPNSMALVLVHERVVAAKFKDHLSASSVIRKRDLRVEKVVGHGAGSGEGEGMKLRAQDKVLHGIKQGRYNIIVATSVAEEGIDIPACQLVVCLNPPTTVKALVQMRGRARKKDSFFVVLCNNGEDKDKLKILLQYEQNMKFAAVQLEQESNVHTSIE